MISMFLDTSTSHLILGIYKNKKQIFYKDEEVHNDLSSRVLPLVQNSFNELGISINDLEEIYVVNGPGSFTGIRVGVTIAKTIAWALKIKIYSISELELFATTKVDTDYIIPMIDARRGYVYGGIYDKNGKNILSDQYIKKDELIEKCETTNYCIVSYDSFLNSVLPQINFEKLLNSKDFKEIEPHALNPNYLKRTEAEEKNDKRN
jgi:tRNA threonylcarbamoyl adenosine modification protein YeaZ